MKVFVYVKAHKVLHDAFNAVVFTLVFSFNAVTDIVYHVAKVNGSMSL